VAETLFLSIVTTGFVVAFTHAAIPTHWLPFVVAARGQRWSRARAMMVVALCGSGHVLFTGVLGALVVWLGIETSEWTGGIFPWIAGGALIAFGLYYLVRQGLGFEHAHHHFGAGHDFGHGTDDHGHHGGAERIPEPAGGGARPAAVARSDAAIIVSLFALLTFSPCEGFLPIYLSGISYGWLGFIVLSAVLAFATIAGMVVFTWLTMSGMGYLRLTFLEHYESGILGALILFLGVGVIFLGF
jgi:hypothetical protein